MQNAVQRPDGRCAGNRGRGGSRLRGGIGRSHPGRIGCLPSHGSRIGRRVHRSVDRRTGQTPERRPESRLPGRHPGLFGQGRERGHTPGGRGRRPGRAGEQHHLSHPHPGPGRGGHRHRAGQVPDEAHPRDGRPAVCHLLRQVLRRRGASRQRHPDRQVQEGRPRPGTLQPHGQDARHPHQRRGGRGGPQEDDREGHHRPEARLRQPGGARGRPRAGALPRPRQRPAGTGPDLQGQVLQLHHRPPAEYVRLRGLHLRQLPVLHQRGRQGGLQHHAGSHGPEGLLRLLPSPDVPRAGLHEDVLQRGPHQPADAGEPGELPPLLHRAAQEAGGHRRHLQL